MHSHSPTYGRAFAVGAMLNLAFVLAELALGLRAQSLSLVADASHNFSDVLGLSLAWGASVLTGRRPTPRRTYGLRRSSILAALANAVLLLVAVGMIAWEAIQRLAAPRAADSAMVMAVAATGIVINAATALLFWRGRSHDLNVRGAFLHMMADAGVSAAVVAGGLAMSLTGWTWIDPGLSLAVVAVIAVGTWGLLRDSMNLALDAVPASIDIEDVRLYLAGLPGVTEVHDLHVWGMSTTDVALTAHLVKTVDEGETRFLHHTCFELHRRFGIGHATLQVERPGSGPPCESAADDAI
jgi:cobalt-zinc-cadmium efflux system protein